jgi:hypothetical protein
MIIGAVRVARDREPVRRVDEHPHLQPRLHPVGEERRADALALPLPLVQVPDDADRQVDLVRVGLEADEIE